MNHAQWTSQKRPVKISSAGHPHAIRKKKKNTLYKSVLLYVEQELVAGIAGAPPGGFWLSPSQTENSSGLYDAGILKEQPCVSKMF
jgi:hypothetical protein